MKKLFLSSLLMVFMAALYGCSGGGTSSDKNVKKTVNGAVSFPALSTLVAKQVAGVTPAGTVIPPTLVVTDLSGIVIATPALIVDPSDPKKFTYSTSLDSSNNYVFKAKWDGQVLRALVDKSSLSALTADIKITPVSTATVLVVEQSLALAPGTLGTSGANTTVAQAAAVFLASLPPATIETNITAALVACSSNSGTATAAQAQLASLSNIVTAAIVQNVDAAAFMAGTTAITTVTAVTYTQADGVVTPSSGTVAPADVVTIADSITATLPKITSSGSTTFTAGTAGTFTVAGTGTLSVTGTLPSGITFDPASGLLSGTPATGSNAAYPLTFTATSGGFSVTQAFTLTVTPAAVVPPPSTTSIIGTWGAYGDPTVLTGIITFVDSTHYMFVQAGPADTYGSTGLEYGTYTYNPSTGTGVFDKSPLFDTNGEWGLSHPPVGTSYSISVTGDTLTIGNSVEGSKQLPRMQSNAAKPVIGAWWGPSTDLATGKAGGVLIAFLDDTHCLLAQAGSASGDYSTGGMDGVELGTYTISNNVLSLSLPIDTNGDWGFWSLNPVHGTYPISVSGNALNLGGNIINRVAATSVTNITVADYAKFVGYSRYLDYPNISHTHYYDGVQTVSGRSVNVMREVDDIGSVLKETIYLSSDITSGVYILGFNGIFAANAYPAVLPSFVPGQEYGPYDIMGDGTQMVYVTWTFENVTVPYGTFTNALKQKTRIRTGSVDTISYNWYAKDMGGVKWQDGSNASINEVLTGRNFTWPNSGDVTAQW